VVGKTTLTSSPGTSSPLYPLWYQKDESWRRPNAPGHRIQLAVLGRHPATTSVGRKKVWTFICTRHAAVHWNLPPTWSISWSNARDGTSLQGTRCSKNVAAVCISSSILPAARIRGKPPRSMRSSTKTRATFGAALGLPTLIEAAQWIAVSLRYPLSREIEKLRAPQAASAGCVIGLPGPSAQDDLDVFRLGFRGRRAVYELRIDLTLRYLAPDGRVGHLAAFYDSYKVVAPVRDMIRSK